MEWKDLDRRTKFSVIELILLIILLLFLLCYHYEDIANYFYGTDNDSKGKLLSTILTAIGGICVIIGLYLNNKKLTQQIRQVNEQVRQNDISVHNSNDKRFGETIGYLNNDNEGIVIGGIYALYQLAKEDSRYAPIITNILYSYINNNLDKQNKQSYKTIISLLFSKENPFVFDGKIEFSNITFVKNKFYFKNNHIKLIDCNIQDVTFINCKNIDIEYSNLDNVSFENNTTICISNSKITNDMSILGDTINVILFNKNHIFDSSIFARSIESLHIYNCILEKFIRIESSNIKSLDISNTQGQESNSIIYINTENSIKSLGVDNNELVKVNIKKK